MVEAATAFDGTSGFEVKSHPAPLSQQWSIAMDLAQDVGNRGYIFAKTAADGDAVRYYALYSRANRLRLYYMTAANKVVGVTFAGVSLADGKRHKVLLSADGTAVSVKVDDNEAVQESLLVSNSNRKTLPDCDQASSDGCVFSVGQRLKANGAAAYQFVGTVYDFAVFSNKRFEVYPTISRPRVGADTLGGDGVAVTDWLDEGNYKLSSGAKRIPSFGAIGFSGDAGIEITKLDTAASKMSVAMKVIQQFDESGYLFAKSSISGGLRYYALYSRPGSLQFFYTTKGRSKHSKLTFRVDIADGQEYHLVLAVDGEGAASLYVDNIRIGEPQSMTGTDLRDCSNPDDDDGGCKLFVGQRASKSSKSFYGFEGLMREGLLINGAALEAYPFR